MDLKRLVEQSDTPAGRWFDNTVFALIVVSLVTFSIETLPNLSPDIAAILWWAELLTVALFTIEHLLRISVAERRWRFIRSFGSLIDLAAILPFYLSFGAIDLRSLRTFRLLRLLRILKLQRYSRVVRRMHRAGIIVREEMILFLSTYKPVLDDAPYRAFDSTAEYRRWCNENLPMWLGYWSRHDDGTD